MNTFLYRFDKTITSAWYFALLCLLAVIYFGSGVLVTWSNRADVQAEREARILAACDAPLRADIHGCRTGNNCQFDGASFLKISGVK